MFRPAWFSSILLSFKAPGGTDLDPVGGLVLQETPQETIDSGGSGSKPERSFSSPHNNHNSSNRNITEHISAHPTHQNKQPTSASPSVPMGSSSDIAHGEYFTGPISDTQENIVIVSNSNHP